MLVPAISPAGDATGGEGSNGFRRFRRFEHTQATAKRARGERAAVDAFKVNRHRGTVVRGSGGVLTNYDFKSIRLEARQTSPYLAEGKITKGN